MKVKFIKLHQNAQIPTRGSENAAAYDLYACETVYIPYGKMAVVGTGLAIELPPNHKGEIYSRSGLASDGVFVPNAPGKIDPDYRGEVKVILYNTREELVGIEAGSRIAQLEVNPFYTVEFEEVEELSNTERGEGGLGSTGV